ncbi:MAG TPA: hypothetical protein VKW06_18920 [Candidatus Angelobacter sp.]|nr:hypothetical protein [Candidatus Angelobacter sp.]
MSSFSLGRRRFTVAAVAAAAGAVIPSRKAGGEAAPPKQSTSALDKQAKAVLARLSPQARAEVEMKVAEVLRKHGSTLSTEQKADIRKVMAEMQEGLEKMRTFALDNGDQPATVFHAYRSEGNE